MTPGLWVVLTAFRPQVDIMAKPAVWIPRNLSFNQFETMLFGGSEGSNHKVAAKIIGAESCNGWTFWHYKSGNSLKPIDDLRQRLRPTN